MRVNVIGKSNGVGLSRDLELMAEVLRGCGCEVSVTAVDSRESHRRRSRLMQWGVQLRTALPPGLGARSKLHQSFDLNVMLEHVWTQFLEHARQNIAVPNPEWFDRHDMRFHLDVDRVWAKTINTERIFSRLGNKTSIIGFDSEDRYDPAVKREGIFFHLAGKSTMKGTARLIELWRKHPEWPKLILIWHAAERDVGALPSNIEYCDGYLDDAALKRLQNRCIFHVCTSETEGWGHYLAEALSVGAVTLTVDAPPMNELVTREHGLLVPYRDTLRQKQAQRYLFDEEALSQAVGAAVSLDPAAVATMGAAARSWFLRNKQGFHERVAKALGELHA